MQNRELEKDRHLSVIARALGYLCLSVAEMKDAPLRHAVEFLERLGFTRSECAAILNTTTESIRVTMAKAVKPGRQLGNSSKRKRRTT
jgi:hypothetical protein